MSRSDRAIKRLDKSVYRHNADEIAVVYRDGATQTTQGIVLKGVEVEDSESGLLRRVITLGCLHSGLSGTMQRGVSVTHENKVYKVGATLTDDGHEITVEIA